MQIRFKRDTIFRKGFFTPESFAHPAKMDAQLLIWLVEKYTKEGDTILDPMFGSGTLMLACTLGRNVIGVELEQKFIDMAKANWEIVKMKPQLGSPMGWCEIRQGDARDLEGVLADTIITSPPYAETLQGSGAEAARKRISEGRYKGLRPDVWTSKGNIAGSTFGDGYSQGKDNISNLPYGDIDSIITSPPYEGSLEGGSRHTKGGIPGRDKKLGQTGTYDQIDAVISSPPYEGSVSASTGGERDQSSARQREARLKDKGYDPAKYQGGVGRNLEVDFQYSKADENIGNLKSANYLQAMLQVYQSCFRVLKDGGLLILITKNFIRNQKEVRLDTDTIKLCEQAGFKFLERHYRKLPAQSFWRIIYKQKYPSAPEINHEDILVLRKR